MDQQRRVLSNMTNGLPVALTGTPATIHILDLAPSANDANGRPFADVVSLYVQNSDDTNPARVNVILTPPGGTPIIMNIAVATGTIVRVFDETALGGIPLVSVGNPPLGGATIQLSLDVGDEFSTQANAWGWFVRS